MRVPVSKPTPSAKDGAHFHAWRLSASGNAFFRVRRRFETRQAAHQWVVRREPDFACRLVLECRNPECT